MTLYRDFIDSVIDQGNDGEDLESIDRHWEQMQRQGAGAEEFEAYAERTLVEGEGRANRRTARELKLKGLKAEMQNFCDVGDRFTYLGIIMLVTDIRVDMKVSLKGVPGNVIYTCDYASKHGTITQSQFGYEQLATLKKENGR